MTSATADAPAGPHTNRFGAIRLTGADRTGYLQGQLSNDLRLLTPDRPLFAGWANPQGRLICITWVLDWQQATWLLLPQELLETVLNRLRMFVLRSDVRLEIAANAAITVELPTHNTDKVSEKGGLYNCFYDESSVTLTTPRIPGMGLRIHASNAAQPEPGMDAEWALQAIRAGIPTIRKQTSGEFVPQMVNLDLLGGISFSKGCYVGQEIVARTQNLGRIKRRMLAYRVRTAAGAQPGDPVFGSAGAIAGQIVNSERSDPEHVELLAVMKLDSLGQQLSLRPNGEDELARLNLPYPVPECAA